MRPRITEAEFTRQVIALARLHGWRVLHIRPGRTARGWRTPVQGDGVGFCDLLMLRGAALLVVELKVGKGRLTAEQAAWLLAFRQAGVDARVWTEACWPEIEETLGACGFLDLGPAPEAKPEPKENPQ